MREGQFKNSSGCAIACIFHSDGHLENGTRIKKAMQLMHDRSNGLGGGFVGYGIYPAHREDYALHLFYDDVTAKEKAECFLEKEFICLKKEEIPTNQCVINKDVPLIWRYFIKEEGNKKEFETKLIQAFFKINQEIQGAYIFSCGKNMGIFKGVGYPEDIADFFQLDTYYASTWIAHGRYPTNTPGWWAGAHPFGMLDFALVHNGEISSYDTNRRYIEPLGYPCCLLTDTEVITYLLSYLNHEKGLTFEECADILAAPLYSEIDKMEKSKRCYYTQLRKNFGSFLITGPFSIILGHEQGIFALNDRLKLRALMIGQKGQSYYLASEESAVRAMQMELDSIYSLEGGKPFIKNREVNHYEKG
ncbi:class II glutamine amidotransferase domain-containing protein [Beduini massiliensis]|uniref:hypothetical protein n=1 Tax=Beduini massiliensis TaxID=1585974 RepID=UPI000A6B0475|nr:hypothetical protein [Beduini massiliensis]